VARRPDPHIGGFQEPLFLPDSSWSPPVTLPDLRGRLVGFDLETCDRGLALKVGSSWYRRGGHVAGVGLAWEEPGGVQSTYVPIAHPDSQCFTREVVAAWLSDHIASGTRFVTQGGLYDWGWASADLGVRVPEPAQLEEVGAAATLVDENRYEYNLDALCRWRGLPGKDEALGR
jgi:hypothetical protein